MPAYRIYRLKQDNHISGVPYLIECNSDQDVIAHAKGKIGELDIEVWDGSRLVIRLTSPEVPAGHIRRVLNMCEAEKIHGSAANAASECRPLR